MPPVKADEAAPTAAAASRKFTVAKNRTVSHQPTSDDDVTHYLPGEEIELPVKEGTRLQKLGFLVRDDGTTFVPMTEGPKTEAGDEIPDQGASSGEGRVTITEA